MMDYIHDKEPLQIIKGFITGAMFHRVVIHLVSKVKNLPSSSGCFYDMLESVGLNSVGTNVLSHRNEENFKIFFFST